MTSADSIHQTGANLQLNGDEEGARLHYLAALTLDPFYVPSMANLAAILSNNNQLNAAAALLQQVVGLVPHDGIQWSNLGNVLMRLERYEESEFALSRAAERVPDNIGLWHNWVLLCHRTGRQDEALYFMDYLTGLGGETLTTRNDKAHLLLAKGDLKNGLIEYEARWHTLMHLEPWDFHIPEWEGQDLAGKNILFHAEQGFGDTIMTARFADSLAIIGAAVTLGLPKSLCRLFEHQPMAYDVIDIAEMTEADARRFDFHSPMYSAMRHLGVDKDEISGRPYLKAPALTSPPIPRGPGIKNVGICWASGKRGTQMDWRRRVSDLKLWLRLAEVPGVVLWSLIPEQFARDEISALGAEGVVRDPTRYFEDFADTAVFIDKLDLVITVDTAVAHLAAAMGKQTWMLSQFTPCWRWWDLKNHTGKPWYDSMTILTQDQPNAWEAQIESCVDTLCRMAIIRRRQEAAE